jgi:hypothetical protein
MLTATTTPPEPYSDPRRWWVLAACCTVAFAQMAEPHLWMIGFDIPASAFGAAWRDFRILANLGVLLFIAFQLVGGVLGDLLGRRRIFLVGAVGTTVFNVLSLLAPDLSTLTVTRAFVGVMGALALPLSLGIIRLTFMGDERIRALMIYTFVTSLGVLAALLGIPFEYWFGWRSTLVLPILVGAVGVVLAWRYVPESRARGGFSRAGAITAAAWTLVFLAIIFGLVTAHAFDAWRNPITVAALGAGGIGLVIVVLWTQYAGSNGLFRNAEEVPRHFLLMLLLISAALTFALVGYALQLYNFFFNVQQIPAILAGVALAPIMLGNIFVLRLASRFVIERPTYVAVGAGLAAMAAAMLLTSLARPSLPYLALVPMMMLFGLGFLVASASWSYFFFGALPADLIGMSCGINRAASLVGSALTGVLLATIVEVAGTADFKLRLADLGLTQNQQQLALQAVDAALRLGVTTDDMARRPAALASQGLLSAYRESLSVGISSALFTGAIVCAAAAALAWFWLRRIHLSADVAPAGALPAIE